MEHIVQAPNNNPKLLSPLTLAFIGDGVYELLVRERLVAGGSMPVGKLHSLAVQQVRASCQSKAYFIIENQLTEEELSVMKRGRNASGVHPPKNSDPAEYRRATGLEALFGFLYLKGEISRLNSLFDFIQENLKQAEGV
ncbi:MAG: ribonuclease III [Oscillospiraceae bacterium]|nr:ribonuclease III [Oscillospiraceae bacterium]